jgi:hypothetical protein
MAPALPSFPLVRCTVVALVCAVTSNAIAAGPPPIRALHSKPRGSGPRRFLQPEELAQFRDWGRTSKTLILTGKPAEALQARRLWSYGERVSFYPRLETLRFILGLQVDSGLDVLRKPVGGATAERSRATIRGAAELKQLLDPELETIMSIARAEDQIPVFERDLLLAAHAVSRKDRGPRDLPPARRWLEAWSYMIRETPAEVDRYDFEDFSNTAQQRRSPPRRLRHWIGLAEGSRRGSARAGRSSRRTIPVGAAPSRQVPTITVQFSSIKFSGHDAIAIIEGPFYCPPAALSSIRR